MNKAALSSFIILCLLSTVFLMELALNTETVSANGTIIICEDGGIDPPDAPISSADNVTYILTADINESIDVMRSNIIIDGMGYSVEGTGGGTGIGLLHSGMKNVTIKNVEVKGFFYGIELYESSNNSLSGNNITANSGGGIFLTGSSNNTISGNNIINCSDGIFLGSYSSNNMISHNNITLQHGTAGEAGIDLVRSANNTITMNTIHNYAWNMWLRYSSNNNTITRNNIMSGGFGVILTYSSNNTFHHNNFINNTILVDAGSLNVWDDGYPSGGNYWSDYAGVDLYSGSYQNDTGRDGIVDTPYIIDSNNQDNYPWKYQGGFIPIQLNETLTNYNCPVGAALNFTYTLNSTMHVYIRVNVFPFSDYDVYAKWDGSRPTLEDYDCRSLGGFGTPSRCYKRGLPPRTYYFMIYHDRQMGPLSPSTFNVTLIGYYPVHNLNTSLSYPTIQAAIDADETLNGHTINVDEGMYHEHVVVDKSISLIGQNRETTVIDGNYAGNVIELTASDIIITSFTLQRGADYGLILFSNNNIIVGNTITSNYLDGINLQPSNGNHLVDNTITSNGRHGIRGLEWNDGEIIGNIITGHYDDSGIFLTSCNNITLMNNSIRSNSVGINFGFSDRNLIDFNLIFDNERNIKLGGSRHNMITYNNISNSLTGIQFWPGSEHNVVSGNVITNNVNHGIWMDQTYGDVCNNTIFHNNFINNTKHVHIYTTSCSNKWDDEYSSGGNYWIDYASVDLYSGPYQNENGSDGIWDHPYIIDEHNQDNYPLVNPWSPYDLNNDRSVNIKDLIIAVKAFGSHPDNLRWDPVCDFNRDGKVDMRDLVSIVKHFGS